MTVAGDPSQQDLTIDRAPGAMPPAARLAVGLTGHRLDRLGEDGAARLGQQLDAVLALIERSANGIAPADLRLVTGLADGADAIGADVALARGWRIDAVLPFFRDDYAGDFADGAGRDTYRRQLDACGAVFELDSDLADPGGHGVAYERAGRVTVAQSDLLIAVWDGGPARGRGGAPQIVAEAVLAGVPVIQIDPTGALPDMLLWDGLEEIDLGQQTIETVARGNLDALPRLLSSLLEIPEDSRGIFERFTRHRHRRWTAMVAYPLLLAVAGVRRLRLSDFRTGNAAMNGAEDALDGGPIHAACRSGTAFAARVAGTLAPRFAYADLAATRLAQVFRSSYVSNFGLAALAVILSLTALALPAGVKPLLLVLEILAIGTILVLTQAGNRARWHRRWLDSRALAERLRCLAVSAQLGDLELRAAVGRAPPWVAWYVAATARTLGLPSGRADQAYLGHVRDALVKLIDDQTAYLAGEARRMHKLEHRLHLTGTTLFAATTVTCVIMLGIKLFSAATGDLHAVAGSLGVGATIISAALPAVGAAIYGIRMQGDFAGIVERDHTLAEKLTVMRRVIEEDALAFDTLTRRARRVSGLLTHDLGAWLQTYHARPLALPG